MSQQLPLFNQASAKNGVRSEFSGVQRYRKAKPANDLNNFPLEFAVLVPGKYCVG